MMTSLASVRRPRFNVGKTFVARKPFTVQGKHLETGDRLDWKTLGLSERLLRQLWSQSYIDNAQPEEPAAPSDSVPAPLTAHISAADRVTASAAPLADGRSPPARKK